MLAPSDELGLLFCFLALCVAVGCVPIPSWLKSREQPIKDHLRDDVGLEAVNAFAPC